MKITEDGEQVGPSPTITDNCYTLSDGATVAFLAWRIGDTLTVDGNSDLELGTASATLAGLTLTDGSIVETGTITLAAVTLEDGGSTRTSSRPPLP